MQRGMRTEILELRADEDISSNRLSLSANKVSFDGFAG